MYPGAQSYNSWSTTSSAVIGAQQAPVGQVLDRCEGSHPDGKRLQRPLEGAGEHFAAGVAVGHSADNVNNSK